MLLGHIKGGVKTVEVMVWRLQLKEIWQGKKDSNLRMSESKSDALTNLATPLHWKLV
jgi:hypothetical protein